LYKGALTAALWPITAFCEDVFVSDEKKDQGGGGGFGGPKKPRATFGDVMLGIPSGGREEKRERKGERKGERREGKPEAAATEGEQQAAPERTAEPRPPKKRERGEKKPQGPMVVVKRASGVVETRGTVEPKPAASSAEGAAEGASAQETPASAQASREPSHVLYEEVQEAQSFAEMFEQNKQDLPGRRTVKVGDKVSGPIFQLGADTAFISLGGKSEAMIELRELKDEQGVLRSGVGDMVEAFVVEAGARGILLSRSLGKGAASMAMLAEARASGMPVEGLVLSVNKGGLEVAVGDVRAFCPVSQIDLKFVEKPDQFVGERLKFRVTEVRERNVVLSRRAILEEEQKVLAAETRKGLDVGKTVKGKVTGVRDFGAFVDLGGLEGMIPVSELSHTRVGHPSDVLKVGDVVEVDVLRMEPAQPNSPDKAKQKERITLSLRSRQEDPWKKATEEIKEGDRLKGKIARLQPFGAFVELRPGVDGLIHISALSNRRIAHPRDVVSVGDEVEVTVEKVDPAEKRISLRRITAEEAEQPAPPKAERQERAERAPKEPQAPRPRVGQIVQGKVDRIEPYGVFLVFPGGRGLVPASETGTDRGTDMKRAFSLGQELKVEVLDIDSGGKIRLSMTAAVRSEERADAEQYMKANAPKGAGKKGFGTFADLLKDKKLT
jgi:small subunit ribosomal protein S1